MGSTLTKLECCGTQGSKYEQQYMNTDYPKSKYGKQVKSDYKATTDDRTVDEIFKEDGTNKSKKVLAIVNGNYCWVDKK